MSNATLIAGSFRCLDFSGCETTHSPKVRTGREVDAAAAQEGEHARRGYEQITLSDGTATWARRSDKPLFDAAEKVLAGAQLRCRALIWAVSVPMGTGRAVPAAKYPAFEVARQTCQDVAKEANESEEVRGANEILSGTGRAMGMRYLPGLFSEMTLADPEDQARAQRLQESCAESIAVVLAAVRSQDREQIRQALDNVGALGEALAGSAAHADVTKMLDLAQKTLTTITERKRAAAVANKAITAESGRRARQRAEAAAQELQQIAAQAEQVAESLSRWQVLDLRSDAEAEARELTPADIDAMQAAWYAQRERDRRPLDIDAPQPQTEEERIAYQAAVVESEQRQQEQDGRFGGLEVA